MVLQLLFFKYMYLMLYKYIIWPVVTTDNISIILIDTKTGK